MRSETFSYLPPLTDGEVRAQVESLTGRGLLPAIEYSVDPDVRDLYWRMWKLPFVGRPSAEAVIVEIEQCAAANPQAHIKLAGYDSVRQGQVLAFVVRRPQ